MQRASIIIPVYNGYPYLEACLDSVKAEISSQDEVIVVDNASPDESVSLITQKFPWVRLILSQDNLGFAAACNLGAKKAIGDYYVFLNQDTFVHPGWLSGLLNYLNQDEQIGIVTSKLMLMRQPERVNACGQDIHFSGMSFQRGTLQPGTDFQDNQLINAISGASFAIRSNLWSRLGGFDEYLFMYYEDTDLSWRARRLGFESWFTPNSIVYHDDSLNPSEKAIFYSERNRLILLWKHWKTPTLLLLLPGLFLSELIDWGYRIFSGRSALHAKLQSVQFFFTHSREIAKIRNTNPRDSLKPDWYLLQFCSSRFSPRRVRGGPLGKGLIYLSNLLLNANYWLALNLTQKLGI